MHNTKVDGKTQSLCAPFTEKGQLSSKLNRPKKSSPFPKSSNITMNMTSDIYLRHHNSGKPYREHPHHQHHHHGGNGCDDDCSDHVISRWQSQEIPAFPLPIGATSPKYPLRQASIGGMINKISSASFVAGADTIVDNDDDEDDLLPALPPPMPDTCPLRSKQNYPPNHPTRMASIGFNLGAAGSNTKTSSRTEDSCARQARRFSSKEQSLVLSCCGEESSTASSQHESSQPVALHSTAA